MKAATLIRPAAGLWASVAAMCRCSTVGWACLVAFIGAANRTSAAGTVVINEMMYHPAEGRSHLQYVELFNRGPSEMDLSKWSLAKAIRFVMPEGTRLGPGEFLVVCRDTNAFASQYGPAIRVCGNFSGKLSHKAERLELLDARGQPVDSVNYSDRDGWPEAADGYSSALERIDPLSPSDLPANWAAGNWGAPKRPAGTPGRKNDSFAPNLPPLIDPPEMMPKIPAPQQDVKVRATVADRDGVQAVLLLYQLAAPGGQPEEHSVPMNRTDGDGQKGAYEATIEGQPHGQLVRYRIKATDQTGTVRWFPSPNDPRPSCSFVPLTLTNASVPTGYVINVGRMEKERPHNTIVAKRNRVGARGNGAFVYVPAGSGAPEVFDHVRIGARSGGYKLHFHKGHSLLGMTGISLVAEGPLRWILAEHLSYVLYRLANVPAPLTDHLRLVMDGRLLGIHLLVEEPNKVFLARNGRDDTGNLYKLAWYGETITEQHQKRTNRRAGHADLLQLLEGIKVKSPAEQWSFIEENFNVEECASYYAVNMCIQNWDGFFNNYFAYHDSGRTGKWEIYPWDEDKTWGDYDGASPSYDWYEMPLTYGMAGARSPRDFARWGAGTFGGVSWWRPPGHFSGPLLANPQFRQRFLARLREICDEAFTVQKFFPLLDAMEKRLEPEILLRSSVIQQDRRAALQEFADCMDSFREQVQNRRKFILKELARTPSIP